MLKTGVFSSLLTLNNSSMQYVLLLGVFLAPLLKSFIVTEGQILGLSGFVLLFCFPPLEHLLKEKNLRYFHSTNVTCACPITPLLTNMFQTLNVKSLCAVLFFIYLIFLNLKHDILERAK